MLTRLLASSVIVAVCSITATAWLSVQRTSESISVRRGETLAVDTRIHGTLVGYAASHPGWAGVEDTVRELADETGRRIALTTENRVPIADSAQGEQELPRRTSAVVDPLAVDLTLAPDAQGRIDPRAVGPFSLPDEERSRLLSVAESGAACLDGVYGLTAEVEVRPSGRPVVTGARVGSAQWSDCGLDALDEPTDTEREALEELAETTASCLPGDGQGVRFGIDGATGVPAALAAPSEPPADEARAPADPVPPSDTDEGGAGPEAPPPEGEVLPVPAQDMLPSPGQDPPSAEDTESPEPEGWWLPPTQEPTAVPPPSEAAPLPESADLDPAVADCVDAGRRAQLEPYVAPAALLFIDDPSEGAESVLSLSGEGLLRIGGMVLLVLVPTVLVSVAVSARLVRPVRALTDAVQRTHRGRGPARVDVSDSGEIGRLATAFNAMSEHLERLEEQRRGMISDISHELRTPLSNLRGWLEAAQDGVAELDPERVRMLLGEARLLQEVIDDLRDLALADAGELRLSLELVSVDELVEQAVSGRALRAGESGLELVADTAPVELRADRTRLLQAVGNLLDNALRHTAAPGKITVRARREDDEAVVEVEDTGSGIAEDDLPHVFDRFWRAEKSRSRRTGGSGLGLAIVRDLAGLHGGGVSVSSVLGEGTVFTLRLPLAGPPNRGTPAAEAGARSAPP
ncbi:sensor histidine kinase [Nocardiopsis algeriensis]|uniref:histidine kinase n=1 Tax=Nocardiopsis algeriensis TaxID=1478215 RepID=A0A841IID3_9ACTN|nr:HAMP domain-containing sensor histidine kinase [Nocardiopsis algeriensis]MBB6118517.1 two-component system sensor histidine kinase BaeS [Nocardiopsis algeriensis]